MLDICEAIQACKPQEISNLGIARSSHNMADGRAKLKAQEALYQLLATAYHNPKVNEWLVRDPQRCIIHHKPTQRH